MPKETTFTIEVREEPNKVFYRIKAGDRCHANHANSIEEACNYISLALKAVLEGRS